MTRNYDDAARRYLAALPDAPLLSAEQEKELATKAQAGCTASRERMISSNLRLVVMVAGRYLRRSRDLSMSDLISEGNIGLMTAVEKFDPTRGRRFSTMAVPWISQAIGRAITDKGRSIRLPAHLQEGISLYLKAAVTLRRELGRKPDRHEIAARIRRPLQLVATIEGSLPTTVSGDAPVVEGGSSLLELVPDPNADPVAQMDDIPIDITTWLDTLTPVQRAVIVRRYGLDGGEALTFEAIGKVMQFSRNSAHEAHRRAIATLRGLAASAGILESA